MGQPITHAQVLSLLRPLPLDFTPGARFAYSNSNYYLLGDIVLLSNQANSGASSFLGLALTQIMLGQS